MADMGNMFPTMWKYLLLSQSWTLLAPIVIANRYVYSILTKQPFRFQYTNALDLWIIFWFTFELYYHFVWEEEENMGMMLSKPPSKNHQYF